MKLVTLIVASLLVLNVFSQSQTDSELVNTFLKAEKKALVAQNMNLTNENAEAFWELYDAYSIDRESLTKNRTAMLESYISEFEEITDEQLNDIVSENFGARNAEVKLMKKYHKKMKKEVGVKVATRFYMVEEQIQLILRVSMWEMLPMVDTHVDKVSQRMN